MTGVQTVAELSGWRANSLRAPGKVEVKSSATTKAAAGFGNSGLGGIVFYAI